MILVIGSDFTETYTYDVLNRLKKRTIAGGSTLPTDFQATQDYVYDNWGNITEKTGVGHYEYDSTKVHQLMGVYDNAGFTGAASYAFVYDLNGNVTNDGTRAFTYGSFDKPTNITKGSASSNMLYGVDRELYYKHDTVIENGSTVQYKRYYIGAYEKLVRIGGNGNMTEHKYNIGNTVLTYRNGSNTTSFVHSDNQGSVIATTSASGQVVTQDIYDPFGKQGEVYRAPVYLTSLPPITDKGYTGHKQMNHVDIIHMGGRIYDPTLGRFLQADPHIQAPKNSQNYNRYSYVLNNPMSMTDPTGYFFSKLWEATTGKVLRAIASVPLINTAINVGLNFVPGCQIWCSAAFSAATTYAVTGSLKASLTAGAITAATAYAFSEIGAHFDGLDGLNKGTIDFGGNLLTGGEVAQQITAHAFVGGISAELQGGKFGHGFFSAGVTKGIGGAFLPGGSGLSQNEMLKGTFISAVIGGTTSKISGGKFANGAQTGAFQYLLNQVGENYPFGKETQMAFADQTPDSIRDLEGEVANILINQAKGKYAEYLAAEYLQEHYGADVLVHGVTLMVDGKLRFPDITAKFPDGSISFIEVKSGAARLNRQQIRMDQKIETTGANVFTAPHGNNIVATGQIGPTNTMLMRVYWEE